MHRQMTEWTAFPKTTDRDAILDKLFAMVAPEPAETLEERVHELATSIAGLDVSREYVHGRTLRIKKYQRQLRHLMTIPTIEQRSREWYDARQSMVTASDLAQALGKGKFGTQKEFIVKKCGYVQETFDASCPPLRHGIMFEPVACELYSRRNGVVVHEFGLLRHPRCPYFGASPDGITEQGIMLEIKCPWRRQITGTVPEQYYHQMQGQLDVCDLDECAFLECKLDDVVDPDEIRTFWEDYDEDDAPRGAIIEAPPELVEKGQDQYVYSPMGLSRSQLQDWVNTTLASSADGSRLHCWRLRLWSDVRVRRDREYIATKLTDLKPIWDKIIAFRDDRAAYDTEMNVTHIAIDSEPMHVKSGKSAPTGYAFVDE
jgi:putative phage-type endonuclease